MFTDTHCHTIPLEYDNIADIVKEAKDNNVYRLIVSSYNQESALEVLKLISDYDNVYGTIGLHPENIHEDFDWHFFDNLPNKIIAIGEIGLDYHYGKDDKEQQIVIFEKQMTIAEKLGLPVVIHSRDATLDTLNIVKKYHVKGVIHSFSGSYETALEYIKLGYRLGINGVITFKNANIKEVFKKIDKNYILLETDSPYLTPVPYRGKKNSPAHIVDIAKFVADLYNISLDELSRITESNIKATFDI